jgi:phosphohistidine phosphatase
MKLIIMRHGEAERFRVQDKTRSLTGLGKKQASTAGRWLNAYLGVSQPINVALISSYTRAQQTFEQLSEQVVVVQQQVCEDIIPEGNPKIAHDFIKLLFNDKAQPSVILIVSHMPFVSHFLEEVHIDKKSMLFDTSSVVVVDYDLTVGVGSIESVYHPS